MRYMKRSVILENGKYEVIHEAGAGKLYANRYGSVWRDMVGDGMILAMFEKIKSLEAEVELYKPKGQEFDWGAEPERKSTLTEEDKENQGVEQAHNPFFRMVGDANVQGILNTLSQMSTLTTGLMDEKWVIDTDGFIIGDPILKLSTDNAYDAEFYASAIDMVLYLTHEVKRLREGYAFLEDGNRAYKNLDVNDPDSVEHFIVSLKDMACANLNGVSHNGNKRKFFANGKELPN